MPAYSLVLLFFLEDAVAASHETKVFDVLELLGLGTCEEAFDTCFDQPPNGPLPEWWQQETCQVSTAYLEQLQAYCSWDPDIEQYLDNKEPSMLDQILCKCSGGCDDRIGFYGGIEIDGVEFRCGEKGVYVGCKLNLDEVVEHFNNFCWR